MVSEEKGLINRVSKLLFYVVWFAFSFTVTVLASPSEENTDDFKETTEAVDGIEQARELVLEPFIRTRVHSHPLLEPLSSTNSQIRTLKTIATFHQSGVSDLSAEHLLAYIYHSMPRELADVYDWSSEQYAIALLENLKIDLWLQSELGFDVLKQHKFEKPSDFSSLLELYKPKSINWPDKLSLGIRITLENHEDIFDRGPMIETFQSEILLGKNDFDAPIQTYKLTDSHQTYSQFL